MVQNDQRHLDELTKKKIKTIKNYSNLIINITKITCHHRIRSTNVVPPLASSAKNDYHFTPETTITPQSTITPHYG